MLGRPTLIPPDGPVPEDQLEGPGYLVAQIGNLVVGFWRRSFELREVLDLRRVLLRAHARRGERLVLLTTLHTDAMELGALEDERVRKELVSLARELDERTAASAIVIEGGGFKSAAIRTAAAGVMLVSRLRFPNRAFDALPSATSWLMPYLQPAPSPSELAATLARLRDRVAPPRR